MSETLPGLFLTVLSDLTAWLDDAGIPALIVGGVAASLLGRPRATRDIDALAIVPEDRWPDVLDSAQQYRIVPRIQDPLEFAGRTRVLLLRHSDSAIDIDLILGRLSFEKDAIARGRRQTLGGVTVLLPQVEDLLIMKAVAQRPQDLRDIEGLLDSHPDADLEHVRRWVREFSTAMTMPDLLEQLEALLARRNLP